MSTLSRVNAADEVFELLLTAPTPQQILDFRVSAEADAYLERVLDKNREGIISSEERTELEDFSHVNHSVTRLKLHAYKALKNRASNQA